MWKHTELLLNWRGCYRFFGGKYYADKYLRWFTKALFNIVALVTKRKVSKINSAPFLKHHCNSCTFKKNKDKRSI
ncbi:hypothetical protein IX84_29925 [Phaeodactylibacter xiamenensis]|uniref:Uncharacterized protein n=1 Tax=Phaeodactylibacter xiamenensis TaxID=1524460 RepID=A0A098RYW7_9BACT|nr:hypothetical protein IX84_29925 [Phaeodactylibacter xiamenensis]